jgi:hypothetical protein
MPTKTAMIDVLKLTRKRVFFIGTARSALAKSEDYRCYALLRQRKALSGYAADCKVIAAPA